MQRLQHQLRVLHPPHGRAGGNDLWKHVREDQSAGHQLHGVGIGHSAAHESAGLPDGARKDEVRRSRWGDVGWSKCFTEAAFFLSSLIHSIATRVIKLAHAKSSIALAPALVETYSRLLVYMEIESLGIKGFISQSNIFVSVHRTYIVWISQK